MLKIALSKRNFEEIRDAIGRVLVSELNNQKNTLANNFIPSDLAVYGEAIALDVEELPAINVVWAQSDEISQQTAFESEFDHKFLIELYAKTQNVQPTLPEQQHSSWNLTRLAGICYSILMDNEYRNLDFSDKSVIKNRSCKSMVRTQPRVTKDAENVAAGILEIHYISSEITQFGEGVLETNLSTSVKISDTEKGYKYEIQSE